MHNQSDQHTPVTKQKTRQTFPRKNKPYPSPERYSSNSTKAALTHLTSADIWTELIIYYIADTSRRRTFGRLLTEYPIDYSCKKD